MLQFIKNQFKHCVKRMHDILYKEEIKQTMKLTPGQLVDQLFSTNYKCWWAQEKINDMSLSNSERLKAATQAQEYNAKRTKIIRTIDETLGFSEDTNTDKTYDGKS